MKKKDIAALIIMMYLISIAVCLNFKALIDKSDITIGFKHK